MKQALLLLVELERLVDHGDGNLTGEHTLAAVNGKLEVALSCEGANYAFVICEHNIDTPVADLVTEMREAVLVVQSAKPGVSTGLGYCRACQTEAHAALCEHDDAIGEIARGQSLEEHLDRMGRASNLGAGR